MSFILGKNSRAKLVGVHPDLVKVVERAIELTKVDFSVIAGVRTLEEQRKLVASGASQTMNSRHLPNSKGLGCAVDVAAIVNGRIDWTWKYYEAINEAFMEAAKELGVDVEWGGSWKSLKDGPHFQLRWSASTK